MRSPDWYPAWRDEAVDQLNAKNKRLEGDFNLGNWSRYDYDLTSGKLLFSDQNVVRVVADIQIAGSTSAKASNWLWAWSNSNLPSELLVDARRSGSARLGIVRDHGSNLRRSRSLSVSTRRRRWPLFGLEEHWLGELS